MMKSLEAVLNEQPQWLKTFDAPRLISICRHRQRPDVLDSLITQLSQPNSPGPKLAMGLDLNYW
ncbi:MAG: hypothetical protein U0936_02755 [Planctomycetaceae bacterium]